MVMKTWILNKSNKKLTLALIENIIEAVSLKILRTEHMCTLKKILMKIDNKKNFNSHQRYSIE